MDLTNAKIIGGTLVSRNNVFEKVNEPVLSIGDLVGTNIGEWIPMSIWPTELESEARESPSILIVDDDPIFCHRVARIAREKNLSVTVCDTLAKFTALPRELPFDVAVLDYYFGDITANQISHLLKKDIPILVMSAFSGSLNLTSALPRGTRKVLSKDAGIDKIIDEALSSINVINRFPFFTKNLVAADNLKPVRNFVIATAIALWLTITFSFFYRTTDRKIHYFDSPNVAFGQFANRSE